MEAYSVVACNTATTSTNKIHDDDVARQLGEATLVVKAVVVIVVTLIQSDAARALVVRHASRLLSSARSRATSGATPR